MKNKTLQEYLKDLPDDYDVCLSKLSIIEGDEDETGKVELYEVILDVPVVGIVKNDSDTEIRFMIDSDKNSKYLEDWGFVKLVEKEQ